jgi:hypothetical protein
MKKLSLIVTVLVILASPSGFAFGVVFLSQSEIKTYNKCAMIDFKGMACARSRKYKKLEQNWRSSMKKIDLQQRIIHGNYKRKNVRQ